MKVYNRKLPSVKNFLKMILTVHLTASFLISDICIPVLHGRIQCDRLRHFKTEGKTNL